MNYHDFSYFLGHINDPFHFYAYFKKLIIIFQTFWYQLFENPMKIELYGIFIIKYSRPRISEFEKVKF